MTPERCKELLPVFTAYAEGREIECYSDFNQGFVTDRDPLWDEHSTRYRIKPARKLRQWECDESIGKAVILDHDALVVRVVIRAERSRCFVSGDGWWSYERLLRDAHQPRALPCGVYDDE